jgi:hypothetical protein
VVMLECELAIVDPFKASRHYRRAAHLSRRVEQGNDPRPQPTLRLWRVCAGDSMQLAADSSPRRCST